jgi:hypothetical protein
MELRWGDVIGSVVVGIWAGLAMPHGGLGVVMIMIGIAFFGITIARHNL